MKTALFTFFALMIAVAGFAQGTRAPKAAQDDLAKRFPNSTTAKWEQEGDHFEAEWKENGREVAVLYSNAGAYIMTEREISTIDLPPAVVNGISSMMKTAELHEAEAQENADGTKTYQVELSFEGKRHEITLTEKGGMITNDIIGKTRPASEGPANDDDED